MSSGISVKYNSSFDASSPDVAVVRRLAFRFSRVPWEDYDAQSRLDDARVESL